jgi:hypothetical protein
MPGMRCAHYFRFRVAREYDGERELPNLLNIHRVSGVPRGVVTPPLHYHQRCANIAVVGVSRDMPGKLDSEGSNGKEWESHGRQPTIRGCYSLL